MFLSTLFIDKELLQQKREVIQAVPSFWKAHWREGKASNKVNEVAKEGQ